MYSIYFEIFWIPTRYREVGGAGGGGVPVASKENTKYLEYLCFHQVSLAKPSKISGIPVFSQGFLTETFKNIWNTCVFTRFPYQNLQAYLEYLRFHKFSCLAHCPWRARARRGSKSRRGARLQKLQKYMEYLCFHMVFLPKP